MEIDLVGLGRHLVDFEPGRSVDFGNDLVGFELDRVVVRRDRKAVIHFGRPPYPC